MEIWKVTWTDSAGLGTWVDQSEMKELRPMKISSVGYLLYDDPEYITLVQSVDNRPEAWQGDNLICIPKVAVLDSYRIVNT